MNFLEGAFKLYSLVYFILILILVVSNYRIVNFGESKSDGPITLSSTSSTLKSTASLKSAMIRWYTHKKESSSRKYWRAQFAEFAK